MKKFSNILSLGFVLIGFSFLQINAQQTDENTFVINKYFQNINSEIQLPSTSNENLAQYGYQNSAELNILQSGNYNYINVKTNANNQNVGQQGNYNNYEFISFYGRDDLNFEVKQIGNGNSIQILGENSIIDNMKIIQKSDYKTITISNY